MLKTDHTVFLVLLLLQDGKWEEPASYILAIFGALVIRNGYEWDNNTLTKKSFITRIMFTVGTCIAVFLFLPIKIVILGWEINRAAMLFITTLVSDFIVKRGIKFLAFANNKFFDKQESKIE